uniref:Uncharacterized protein n=1 Tax=Setaria italica TaxID=4555 RepID=K3Y472_SETIT
MAPQSQSRRNLGRLVAIEALEERPAGRRGRSLRAGGAMDNEKVAALQRLHRRRLRMASAGRLGHPNFILLLY